MLGRIIAVNRTDMQGLQKNRIEQIPKILADKEKRLRASENPPSEEELQTELEKTKEREWANATFDSPVFSANDRSRWDTIRVLIEPEMRVQRTVKLPDGSERTETVWYAIDKAQNVKGWDTIDMVKHNNIVDSAGQSLFAIGQKDLATLYMSLHGFIIRIYGMIVQQDGAANNEPPQQTDQQPNQQPNQQTAAKSDELREGYLYSSKPPLLPTVMSLPYGLLYWGSDGRLSLEKEPHLVVRIVLVICNLLPLVFSWFLLARLIDRFGTTDWGRLFTVAFVCFGTFISTFVITLNNHLPGVVSVTIALFCAVRITYDKETRWRYFIFAGFFAAFAAACDLPALLFCALLGFWLFCHKPRQTLLGFVPAALVIAGAFCTTNYIAHKTFVPAYAKKYVEDSWYLYDYERGGRVLPSYWKSPAGIDQGEPLIGNYVFHSTIGKHGIFSLTPVWIMSFIGLVCWLFDRRYWSLAAIILLSSAAVFAFYMQQPVYERNYGGMTSAFRWMFWFAPLWSVALVAAADLFSRNMFLRIIALLCLIVSVMSAAYPIWNPWTMPWTYNLMQYLQQFVR